MDLNLAASAAGLVRASDVDDEPASGRVEYVPGTPRLAFERLGRGPTLVFLHGIGGNRTHFRKQLAYFSRTYQAVAWDARGYGASDDYSGPFEMAHSSDDLARLLNHLGVRQAHFVGVSMGGRMLMDFAARFPERVLSLVIAGSFASFGESLDDEQRKDFMRLRKEPLENGRPIADIAPALVEGLLGPKATEGARTAVWRTLLALRAKSYLKALEGAAKFDATATLARIRARVLLIYGQCDRVVPPSAGERLQKLIANCAYQTVPDAGHLVNLEFPDAFNQMVLDFIRPPRR